MFDIGWLELIVIGIVALIVVGPKDLPVMFRNAGRFMGRMRGMAREFQRSMEAAADESGLKDAVKDLNKIGDVRKSVSPTSAAKSYARDFVTGADKDKPKPATSAAPKPAESATAPKAEAEAAPQADKTSEG